MKTTLKHIIIIAILLMTFVGWVQTTTHTITNSGFSFSPANITINLGDTIKFQLSSLHNAVEVSQSTWNSNGNTPNGGFTTPFGGGIVVLQEAKIYYYVCSPHASIGMKGTITVNSTTDIKNISQDIPVRFNLYQNYPNPFNPSTIIRYSLPEASYVTLTIFDIIGREVAKLIEEVQTAGHKEVVWNAYNYPTGVYFYRIVAQSTNKSGKNYSAVEKLLLIK